MTKIRFELRTFSFDTILNHHLSQKLKPIGKCNFNNLINHLINTLNEKKMLFSHSASLNWILCKFVMFW
jgi:hypothetical protein